MEIDNTSNNNKKIKRKNQGKKNHNRSYELRISTMLNHLIKWIKRQKKIINIIDMKCQIANKLIQNEENDNSNGSELKMIDIQKYNDIIKFYQFNEASRNFNQQLICCLDECYYRKYWKQRNYLTELFNTESELFLQKFQLSYNWYNKYNHRDEIFQALNNIFAKLFEIGQGNLKSLLMKYTTNCLIQLLEKFREYFYFWIEPKIIDNSDRFLFISCLLHNFLSGYIYQELIYKSENIVNSKRIFSAKFQLKFLNINKCHSISEQTWKAFSDISYIKYEKLRQKVLKILEYIFESSMYWRAQKQIKKSQYLDIPYDFEQNIFCIIIQEVNIKGFIHRSGKIFINVYPVLKSFNLNMLDLFPILQAYCILVAIIAVNQHQILTKYQNYLIDVIQSKIIDINQPHLALFKSLFGVKMENSKQSNLDKLNYDTAILISKKIKKIYNLEELQQAIIQSSQNKEDQSFMFI